MEGEQPQTGSKPNVVKEEDLQKARDHGWTETTAFNYDEFQRTGGNDRNWLGAGKVYEWSDEYGDVAPEVPELHDILFGGEFQMQKGEHLGAFELEVTAEGAEKITPVFNVRATPRAASARANITCSSKMRDFTRRCFRTFSMPSTRSRRQYSRTRFRPSSKDTMLLLSHRLVGVIFNVFV